MTTIIVVGAQIGDEGKGKVVDVLAEEADIVARFAGGNNAGHTIVVDGKKIVTHIVPSGCVHQGTVNLCGAGMVIDPFVFHDEVKGIQEQGFLKGDGEICIDLDAHIIMPWHIALDVAREEASNNRIGSTRRGVGPCYEDKARRVGIRVKDLLSIQAHLLFPDTALEIFHKVRVSWECVRDQINNLGLEVLDNINGLQLLLEMFEKLNFPNVKFVSGSDLVTQAQKENKNVLLEGAQGAMLDVTHGPYPYVTSSSTLAGGACTGIGIGPTTIDSVWGITKAYVTRVGKGPFDSKIQDPEMEEKVRQLGAEFGATTGRPRMCGWLNLDELKRAVQLNGITDLAVTKLDIVAHIPDLKVWLDGELQDVPHWKKTWKKPEEKMTEDNLGDNLSCLLDLIEDVTGSPVNMISFGPDRKDIIVYRKAFDRNVL